MRLKEPLRFQIIISQYMSKFLAMRLNEPHSQQRLIAYTCMTTNNSWYPIFCIDAEPNLGSNPRIAIKTAFAVKIQNFLQPMTTYFFLLLFFCAFAFGFFRPPPVLDFFSDPFSIEVEALDASAFFSPSCSFAISSIFWPSTFF